MSKSKEHILPIRLYLGIAGTLFILTGITVAVSFVHLGGWNVVVAIGIATVKALLVALFFMHLLYDKKINMIVFGVALVFLGVFIIFTMFDTMNRGDIYQDVASPIQKEAKMYQNMVSDSTHAGHHDAETKSDDTANAPDSGQHTTTEKSNHNEVKQ